jgi:hypothetical protein
MPVVAALFYPRYFFLSIMANVLAVKTAPMGVPPQSLPAQAETRAF